MWINLWLKIRINVLHNSTAPTTITNYLYLNYRSKKYLNYWKSKDHLDFFKNKITQIEFKNKKKLIEKEINNAFKFALKSNFPKKNDLSKHLFKNYL